MTSLNPHDRFVLSTVSLLEQVASGHLERICFSQADTSPRSRGVRTRSKLLRLFRAGYLRRFPSQGTDGWVYLPDSSRATRIDHHALDIAELYTQLVEAERAGGPTIKEWTVREKVTGKFADDVYLWLGNSDFHLEIDRGSEFKPQLRDKVRAYLRAYNQAVDNFPRVVFIVTFNPRGSLADRVRFIQSLVRDQSDLIEVVTVDEAANLLQCQDLQTSWG